MKKSVRIGEAEFFGPFADIASSISEEEWAYSSFAGNVADEIAEYMEKRGISKAELAKRMDKSRPYVTKVLRGDANMTFRTFTSLLHHLEAKVDVHISNRDDGLQWMAVATNRHRSNDVDVERVKYSSPQNKEFVSVSSARGGEFCGINVALAAA